MTSQITRYPKDQIVKNLLETALNLFFARADRFAILSLAFISEEIFDGMLKSKGRMPLSKLNSAKIMEIDSLIILHLQTGMHPRTKNEIKHHLKQIFDQLKHPEDNNATELVELDPDFEVREALLRVIQCHILMFNQLSEAMLRFLDWNESHMKWV